LCFIHFPINRLLLVCLLGFDIADKEYEFGAVKGRDEMLLGNILYAVPERFLLLHFPINQNSTEGLSAMGISQYYESSYTLYHQGYGKLIDKHPPAYRYRY
jgi:hypothetical protein